MYHFLHNIIYLKDTTWATIGGGGVTIDHPSPHSPPPHPFHLIPVYNGPCGVWIYNNLMYLLQEY